MLSGALYAVDAERINRMVNRGTIKLNRKKTTIKDKTNSKIPVVILRLHVEMKAFLLQP